MQRISHPHYKFATMAGLATAVAAACGGGSTDAKGQASLEVYAELQQAGIGGISQMPDGQLIVGYHPFYQTATSTQVALLNADRKSTTPYPAALRQTCRNADGSFVAPIDGNNNLYLTEVGGRSVGIIPAGTKVYKRYVTDDKLIWPDGVTYNADGYMYSGAAQLIQTGVFQSNATPTGTANNAPPYRIYRFRPEAAGTPGS